MPNSKITWHDFYHSVSCTPLERLSKNNWSELFKKYPTDFSCSTPSAIVIGDSIAAGLARFSDVWHNFFS